MLGYPFTPGLAHLPALSQAQKTQLSIDPPPTSYQSQPTPTMSVPLYPKTIITIINLHYTANLATTE